MTFLLEKTKIGQQFQKADGPKIGGHSYEKISDPSAALSLLCTPALATGDAAHAAAGVPGWLCIPFAALLLCVALGPIAVPHLWEKRQGVVVAILSVMLLVAYGMLQGGGKAVELGLECLVGDYIPFIVLLFGLFCVAGNITLVGDLAGSPRINVALLLFGTLLSSCIGTTGSSMLMVRPIIKMNAWRKRKRHIMVFFIFLISNIGGCLTPIGDPPLLMGFSRGVPFFWSLRLFPIMALNVAILLITFYFVDMRAYRKDIAIGRKPDISKPGTDVHIDGLHNIMFLVVIVAAVILSGVLPTLPAFQDASGNVLGIHIYGHVTLTYPALIEIVMILLSALLSFKTTPASVRQANHFTWGAIKEVAVLFIGIFITMQPALMILKEHGASLGLDTPFQLFWVTGALSSFLDNTPTYLVFLTTACTMGASSGLATALGIVPEQMLIAIS